MSARTGSGAGMPLLKESPELKDNGDHPGSFGPDDIVFAHGKTRLMLTADGRVVIMAGAENVHVQLASGKTMRVSRDGDASESEVAKAE